MYLITSIEALSVLQIENENFPRGDNMKTSCRRFLKAESGVAAVETALILPLLLIMYIGMIDLTNLVSENRKLTQATAAVASVISQSVTNITKADIEDTFNAVDLLANAAEPTDVQIVIEGYRPGNSSTPVWKVARGSCSASMSAAKLDSLMAASNDIIVAKICSTYTPYVFIKSFQAGQRVASVGIPVKEVIAVRPRGSDRLTCYKTASFVAGNEC